MIEQHQSTHNEPMLIKLAYTVGVIGAPMLVIGLVLGSEPVFFGSIVAMLIGAFMIAIQVVWGLWHQ